MENLPQNIHYVIIQVDDILVSGASDKDHLSNVEDVLKRLASAGLRRRKNKCVFTERQVTYLGHKVSEEGIQPLDDKVDAITSAPAPKNVPELKSYLGMRKALALVFGLKKFHQYIYCRHFIIIIIINKGNKGNKGKFRRLF